MEIVVLDGHTTNPGDLDWSALERLGETVIYDNTETDEIVPRAKKAQAIITNKVPLTADILSQLPRLQYIGILATGIDHVDVNAAQARGIRVTNVPLYANHSVSQLAFALILELCYRIDLHHHSIVNEFLWTSQPYNSYWLQPLIGLDGKTLGIIGLGKIGQRMAAIGTTFGMRIVAFDMFRYEYPAVKWMTFEELLKTSDFITLHCPLTESTYGMINKKTLAMMKSGTYLVNTSRGGLVVDQDLADALNSGHLAGAGLDVLSQEPPKKDHPLLHAKNCILTPHIGWATTNARAQLIRQVADNLEAFIQGIELNVVPGSNRQAPAVLAKTNI
ncbi:MAG: D-2-hydroxyacid dehydrogenase [Treponema sp.]|nr:D-2-hydroxyacid dehydrogenase [Treponema sp.]